jgi:TolB protein
MRDGSGAHPLTSAGRGIYQPLWSKGGSHILYVKDNSLYLIGADGGEPAKIIGLLTADGPAAGAFGFYGFISYQDQMVWFQP